MNARTLESPDARRAAHTKFALAMAVLDDIGVLVDTVAPRAVPVVGPLLDALADRAAALPASGIGSAVGPELYRWIGMAGDAARTQDEPAVARAVEHLPALLLGRMLAAGIAHGSYRVPVKGGMVRIPQAALGVGARHAPLCTVTLGKDDFAIDGVPIQKAPVLGRIDSQAATTRTLPGSGIFFHQRGDCVAAMLADLNVTASLPVRHDEGLALIKPKRFDAPDVAPIVQNMADGLGLIRRHAPDQAQEVEAQLDAITLVSGQRFVGGSDIYYQGVAVLNPDLDWSSTTYADHLVHEGAHIVLHARNELEPLLENGDAMGAQSPIREDPRPLYGILHSTFVFMRLVQFFARAAGPIGSDEAMFRLHRHLLGFYAGVAELEKHARFTRSGAAFFDGMRAALAQFRSTLPVPDPRFYKRVGKDYVV